MELYSVLSCVCLLSLSIILLTFIQAVAYNGCEILYVAESYAIVWLYHSLFIHFPFNGHLSSFQTGAITNQSGHERSCTSLSGEDTFISLGQI